MMPSLFRPRWAGLPGTLIAFFLLSIFTCWLFGTPSRSSLHVPVPEFPEGQPVKKLVSIIMPTYREADALKRTISDLRHKMEGKWELIVVDDNSQDGTAQVVRQFEVLDGMPIQLITRTDASGLSSAVLEGMAAAKGEFLVVMDADGQHPPDTVMQLVRSLKAIKKARIALGTRKLIDEDWPWYRRLISWGATELARPLLCGNTLWGGGNGESTAGEKRLSSACRDPMTGLFAIRAEVYRQADPLNATGFKVALELLIRSVLAPGKWEGSTERERVLSIDYAFEKRRIGSSKLGVKTMVQYALQLFSLYYHTLGWYLPTALALAATAAWTLGLAMFRCLRASPLAGLCASCCCCCCRLWPLRRSRDGMSETTVQLKRLS